MNICSDCKIWEKRYNNRKDINYGGIAMNTTDKYERIRKELLEKYKIEEDDISSAFSNSIIEAVSNMIVDALKLNEDENLD